MHGGKLWLELSADRLRHNLQVLQYAAASGQTPGRAPLLRPPVSLLAVIKADAYGHGAALCAPVLAHAGAEWLGVTDAAEGHIVLQSLAAAGIPPKAQPRILVMCGMELEDAASIVAGRLTPVAWLPTQLAALAQHASADHPLAVHLEIDTGMARQGARPGDDLTALLEQLRTLPQLTLGGVLTHFASSEIANSPLTAQQAERFEGAVTQIRAAGQRPAWLHAGNTSTLDDGCLLPWLTGQAARLGARLLARSGLALYGYALPLEGAAPVLASMLQPVATWKTRILSLRELSPGETVGYNATFTAQRAMRLGLLPVGYADGLRRELSGSDHHAGGHVMLHGHPAPIVGRISMNLTTVDVTAIPGGAPGDEVTLLGPGITAQDHARLAHTIPYEILCGLRSPRVLVP